MGYKQYKSSSETYLRRARNKKAFDAVLQHYIDVRSGSKIKVQEDISTPHATSNPASPSPIDFVCDVDRIIKKCYTKFDIFFQTYIMEDDTYLNTKEKAKLEQRVGGMFVSRQLYPIKKYYKTERKAKK